MKQFFTLSAALLCSIAVYAQQSQKPVNPLLPKPANAVMPAPATPAKTTGADTRLIATVNFTYGASAFDVEDSSVVSYTGNNGWDYATQGWKFDTGTVWTYDQSTTSWSDDGGVKQVLANNRIMSSLYRMLNGSVWEDVQKSSYTYTSNGLLATEEYEYNPGSGLGPQTRSTHTYNNDKLLTETVTDNWNTVNSQWQANSRDIIHYNAAKQLDTMWQQSWIMSQWMDYMRTINTYANGKLMQTLQQSFITSTWENSYRTVYTYDANGNQSSAETEFWNTGSSTWDKNFRSEYVYNTAGDMIEEKGAHWTGTAFEYQGKTAYTYNQYHRLLSEESQSWNTSTSQWYYDSGDDYLTKNYYEAYTNDVKTVASNRAELKAFPVPAKEQITISASFQQMQPVCIMIRDMSGRIVKQVVDQAGAQYRKSINVADLPAGNYMIHISGTTEVASKMISVTH